MHADGVAKRIVDDVITLRFQGTARNIAAYIDGPRSPPVPDAVLSCDTYPNQCATESLGLDGGACTAVLAMRMTGNLAVPVVSDEAAGQCV